MAEDSESPAEIQVAPEEVVAHVATTDDIMRELRESRQEVTTQVAGVTELVNNVTNIVLNAMDTISSLGRRALDLEQTVTAAATMLRTAAEPQRDDGPDVVNLKTKLLVVAETLGRIAPRRPMPRDPGLPLPAPDKGSR